MNTLQKLIFVIVAIVLAPFVAAQQPEAQGIAGVSATTVGELLKNGGRKLDKDELEKLVKGATISGIRPSSRPFKYTYKVDGALAGNQSSSGGNSYGVFGTWSVNEQGKLCQKYQTTAYGDFGNVYQFCSSYFKIGTEYYGADTDGEETKALKRTVTR